MPPPENKVPNLRQYNQAKWNTIIYLEHELAETICIKWPKILVFIFMEETEESIN